MDAVGRNRLAFLATRIREGSPSYPSLAYDLERFRLTASAEEQEAFERCLADQLVKWRRAIHRKHKGKS